MKILKQGTLPSERVVITRCNNCKTKFEFTVGEAELVFDQRDGNFYKIDCPLCKNSVHTST